MIVIHNSCCTGVFEGSFFLRLFCRKKEKKEKIEEKFEFLTEKILQNGDHLSAWKETEINSKKVAPIKPKRKSIGATPSIVPHEVWDKKKRYFEEELPAGMWSVCNFIQGITQTG